MNDKVAVHRTKELRLLVKNACIDHIALATMDMAAWETLFRCMGFEVDDVYRPDPKSIDKGRTSMHTVVVSAGGTPPAPLPAQFALMEGINATLANDQITEYVSRFGDFVVQHIALRIDSDIFRLAKLWQELGIRFITEHKGAGSPFLLSEKKGNVIVQAFTYPMAAGSGRFIEIKKVLGKEEAKVLHSKEEFRDKNVLGLRERVRAMQNSGFLFSVNIFGEKTSIRESLIRRGISVPPPYHTQMSKLA